MKIAFIPNSSEPRYSIYSPEKQGLIRFTKRGEYEVPISIAESLLSDRPDLFVTDITDIPEDITPLIVEVQIPEPAPSHPFVQGMKKVEQMTKKVPRRLTKKG